MKLKLTRQATGDLLGIAAAHPDREVALDVREAVLESLELLVDYPKLGRIQDLPRVRKLVLPRHPYAMFYMIDDDGLEVFILGIRPIPPAPVRGA